MAWNKVGKLHTKVTLAGKCGKVKYHDTEVVLWTREIVRLDSGGWWTPTTKTRINQAANEFDLGFRVYQEKGEWWVSFFEEDWDRLAIHWPKDQEVIEFDRPGLAKVDDLVTVGGDTQVWRVEHIEDHMAQLVNPADPLDPLPWPVSLGSLEVKS